MRETMQTVVCCDSVPAAAFWTLFLCVLPALLHTASVVQHTRPDHQDFRDLSASTSTEDENYDLPAGGDNPRDFTDQLHSGGRRSRRQRPAERRRHLAEEGSLEEEEVDDLDLVEDDQDDDEEVGCVNCARERQRMRIEGNTHDAQLLKQMRLDLIKQQILDRLGLKQRPNITRNQPRPAIPEPLLRDLDTVPAYSNDEKLDTAKPTEIITFASPVSTCRSSRPAGCFRFDFQENLNPDLVNSAELWVYKLQDPSSSRNHTLVVSELDRHYHVTNRHETRLVGRQAEIQRGWVKFDTRHLVRRWLRRPSTNHGLVVSCPTCEMDPEAVPIANKDEHRVYIVLRMGKPRKRTRRSTKIDCDGGSRQCCRDTLRVNFEEIGWDDWVMQPAWYDAHYCKGHCSGIQYGAHPHSSVLQLTAKFETDAARKEELSMCCSPTKLSAISMLYLDGTSTIIKTDVNEMVVEECGCS